MARCNSGYSCHVCGHPVEDVTTSALYLRYVLGEVAFEDLFSAPEAHIGCEPDLAQYIVDEAYRPDPECAPGPAVPPERRKANLDPGQVGEREARVTRAWRRLQAIPGSGLAIPDYPLRDA